MELQRQGLAQRIREEIAAARKAARSSIDHALRAGELLTEAKAGMAHGEWRPWLDENVQIADRTARAYMRLARRWPALPESERQRVADLPLRRAIAEDDWEELEDEYWEEEP